PIHTIANYDLGKIPNKLKENPLNMVEKMAISTGHCVNPVLHFKAVNNKCVKGHAYGIKMRKDDVLDSVTDILPRCDLDLKINIVIFGEGRMRKIAEEHIKNNFLQIRMPRIMLWLRWLKNIGNKYYQHITIKNKDIAEKELEQCMDRILDNKISSESGLVNDSFERSRAEVADAKNDLNEKLEGTFFRNVYISDEIAENEPLQQVLQEIHKRINKPKNDNDDEIKDDDDDIKNDDIKNDDNKNKNKNKKHQTNYNYLNSNDVWMNVLTNKEEVIATDQEQSQSQPQPQSQSQSQKKDDKDDFKNKPKLIRNLKNELFNEYKENHEYLARAFPTIFPLGIPDKIWTTKGNVGLPPPRLTRHWCLFYDQRFAEDTDLCFVLHDACLRAARNKQASFKIDDGGNREKQFIDLCNSDNFHQRLNHALKEPDSAGAKKLKKTIEPLIKIIDRKIKWSAGKRGDILGKLYALMHFFNIGTHFITISPHMAHNTLAIRLTYTDDTNKKFELPGIELRSHLMEKNPVAATRIFYRLINKFFEIIVGLPLDHFTGKKTKIDRLLKQNKQKFTGPYGFIKSALGIV
ncbi:MAG: hypothetical protein GY739_20115, partial [Mesoflavibacter sp.]|nr:hypothetical protein [Mesoflavibacter sp.]